MNGKNFRQEWYGSQAKIMEQTRDCVEQYDGTS